MSKDPQSSELEETVGRILVSKFLADTDVRDELIALIAKERNKAVREYIRPHLDYCNEQNGRPSCKNCGLAELEAA